MLASPDRLQDPLALHLLLQTAKGLLEGLIFTNFNDWHVSMLLPQQQRVNRLELRVAFPLVRIGLIGEILTKALIMAIWAITARLFSQTDWFYTIKLRRVAVQHYLAAPDKMKRKGLRFRGGVQWRGRARRT